MPLQNLAQLCQRSAFLLFALALPSDAYRLNAHAVLLKSTPLRIDAMP